MKENENIEYNNNKKYTTHKLDTGKDDRKPPENQGLGDNKPVSNLNNDNEPTLSDQESEPKQTSDLDQKAIQFYNALKDKFLFLRPPEERFVSRDKDNVMRYLILVEKLSEKEAQAIISKWEELNLVLVDINTNQIVSKNRDQEANENGNQ